MSPEAELTRHLVYGTYLIAAFTIVMAIASVVTTVATIRFFRRQLIQDKAAIELNIHLQLVASWESDQISAARSRVSAARLRNADPTPNDIETVLDNLEGMAYHANHNNINLDLVWNDFGYAVRLYWHELNNYVLTQRSVRSNRTLFTEVEALNNTLNKEEARRRGIPGVFPTEDERKALLISEATVEDRLPGPSEMKSPA
jgi:hypothetical protein